MIKQNSNQAGRRWRSFLGVLLAFAMTAALAVRLANAQVAASTGAAGKLGAILFRVEFDRLFPVKLTVPPGRYLIQVDNGVVRAPLNLALNVTSGAAVSAKSLSVKASRGSFIAILSQQTYTLSVQGFPQWTSQIVVEAK